MEEKITLNRSVFRSLASDTKIDILKSVDERRKTLSELSKELGMSVSTIKEHLDGLVNSGLIEQKDEGHKWKYYELTKTGNEILHPGTKKLMVILSVALLSMATVVYDLISPLGRLFSMGESVGMPKSTVMDGSANAVGAPMAETLKAPPAMTNAMPWGHIAVIIIISAIIGGCVVYLFLNRKLKVTSL